MLHHAFDGPSGAVAAHVGGRGPGGRLRGAGGPPAPGLSERLFRQVRPVPCHGRRGLWKGGVLFAAISAVFGGVLHAVRGQRRRGGHPAPDGEPLGDLSGVGAVLRLCPLGGVPPLRRPQAGGPDPGGHHHLRREVRHRAAAARHGQHPAGSGQRPGGVRGVGGGPGPSGAAGVPEDPFSVPWTASGGVGVLFL